MVTQLQVVTWKIPQRSGEVAMPCSSSAVVTSWPAPPPHSSSARDSTSSITLSSAAVRYTAAYSWMNFPT